MGRTEPEEVARRCYSCGQKAAETDENCVRCGSMLIVLCEACGSTQSVFVTECAACGAGMTPAEFRPRRRWLRTTIVLLLLSAVGVLGYLLVTKSFSPEERWAALEEAVNDFRAGRYDVAHIKFRRLVDRYPGDAESLYMLAASLYALDRKPEAAAFAQQAVDLGPELPEPRFLLAAWAYEQGDLETALHQAETVVAQPETAQTAPIRAKADLIAGKVLTRPGYVNAGKAFFHLSRAVESPEVDDPEAWVLLAEIAIARVQAFEETPGQASARDYLKRAREVAEAHLADDPKNPELRFFLARIAFAAGDDDQALEDSLRLAKLLDDLGRPATPEQQLFRARLFHRRGDFGQARRTIDPLLDGRPSARVLLESADVYRAMNEEELAKRALARALELHPEDVGVIVRSTRELIAARRAREAEELVRAAREKNRESELLVLAHAEALGIQVGREADAEVLLRDHAGGSTSEIDLRLADLLLDTDPADPRYVDRVREAGEIIAARRTLYGRRVTAYHRFLEGKCALRRSDLDAALAALHESVARVPNDPVPHVFLAEVHRRRLEPELEAMELDSVIRLRGEDPSVLLARADAWLRAGYAVRAEEDVRQAMRSKAEDGRALLLLAEIRIARYPDDPKPAIEMLRRAAALPGAGIRPRLRLAEVLARSGDFEGAEAELAVARSKAAGAEERLDATETLARIRAAARRESMPDESRRTWREFLERHPDSVEGMLRYASALLDARDRAGARVWIERAVAKEPNSIPARRIDFESCFAFEREQDIEVERAEEIARALESFRPDCPEVDYLRGRLALHRGDDEDALSSLGKAASRRPADSRFAYYFSLALERTGDLDRAVVALSRALRMEPGLASARERLAAVRFERGRRQLEAGDAVAAIEELDQSLAARPESWHARALLAQALYEAGFGGRSAHLTRARKVCTDLLAETAGADRPDRERILVSTRFLLGAVEMARRDWPSGAEAFRLYLESRPDDADALLRRGLCLARAGQTDEAIGVLDAARLAAENESEVLAVLLGVYEAAGRADDAIELLEKKLAADPTDAGIRTLLGRFLARAGQTERAEEEFRAALKADPDRIAAADALVYLLLETDRAPAAVLAMRGLLERTGRRPEVTTLLADAANVADPGSSEVESLLRKALDPPPEDPSFRLRALGLLIGRLLAERRIEDARAVVDRFRLFTTEHRRIVPGSALAAPAALAWYLSARVYSRGGVRKPAEACYRRALQLAPRSGKALTNLAELILTDARTLSEPRRSDRVEEALGLATRATEVLPGDAEPWDTLGSALLASGRAREALVAYERSLQRLRADPDRPDSAPATAIVLVHRASAQEETGETEAAKESVEAAIRAFPEIVNHPDYRSLPESLR